jgi:sulfur-carrier protein
MSNLTSNQINVTVKLFAVFQETIHQSEITLSLAPHSPVSAVYDILSETYPTLKFWQSVTRYAVNLSFADPHTQLEDGDIIALIPPVSGG